jgi:phosphatidylserine/phosphatidylglycerophosphate/cardiolipin synthase-like enzyme
VAQKTAHGGYKSGERTLYVLPEAGPKFLYDALAKARRSVKLEVYILTEQGIVDGLIAAKNRGVDVQVMVEPRPYNPGNPHAPLPVNHKAVNALRAGGVPVNDTNPAYTYTHAKFMSVDDATTFVSTANFTRTGLGTDPKGNREYVVEDHVAADVTEFVKVFAADAARQAYTPANPSSVISPVNARTQILDVMASAKKDLLIADEVAGDPQVTEAIRAAAARGVRVRALLEDFKPSASEPDPLNYQTARAWTAAGASVRLMTKPTLHAKAIVADGRSMYVGSENLTTNSLDHNREIGLRLDDPALVAPVLKTTEGDWANAHPAPTKKP